MATTKKDPAAVSLGRRGGLVRVPKGLAKVSEAKLREIQEKGRAARAANLSPKRRSEIAKKAAAARWGKA